MDKDEELWMLGCDAELLIRGYRLRNNPREALTAAERKRWAAECVAVLQRYIELTDDQSYGSGTLASGRRQRYLEEQKAGRRLASLRDPDVVRGLMKRE